MTPYKAVRSLTPTEAAYVAGLVDGEGTITLSRKHAGEQRHLAVTISNTELQILLFVLRATGLTFALWNRQALSLLAQITPFLCSYKRRRADLALQHYVRLTPRNGKYSDAIKAERRVFEATLLGIRATNAAGSSLESATAE